MKFLGIDLGWQTGASGLCCIALTPAGLRLEGFALGLTHGAVLDWVQAQVTPQESALVAVDAPTLIPNPTGMRLPDRLAHRYFGRYDAGCYPANLGRPFAAPLLAFSAALETLGFRHGHGLSPRQPGRFQVELFPHPATVHLFRLEKILKYKKGPLAQRRAALATLRHYQLTHLPSLDPPLPLGETDLPTLPQGGKALKGVEDQLDSLTCAYCAAHYWWWGRSRNWVLGDDTTGFIVVPAPYPDQGWPADLAPTPARP